MKRNCSYSVFLKLDYRCHKCGYPAIPVPGTKYFCPKCGWILKP